jgi:putative NADH-flavin reductase
MAMMAILGATGPTGIHLASALWQSGMPVRVVARSQAKLEQLFRDSAIDKRAADVTDADATARAIDGCDLVYDCIGLPGDQMHLHPVTARSVAEAVRRSGARCV